MVTFSRSLVIYVEGGARGDLAREARRGFATLFAKCLPASRPSVKACGSRGEALEQYKHGKQRGEDCLLLLDSEEVATPGDPWDHPRMQEECPRPHPYPAEDLHFMATVMETWFAACPENLSRFFGNGFKPEKLPTTDNLETASKADVYKALDNATKGTKTKGRYGKGEHSFKLLAEVDPPSVRARCKYWVPRFCKELAKRCG